MNRKMFLIVVDAHLKLMEVEIVNSATSQATTECLRMRFGLPEMIVLTMEHALPVVSFKSLHNAITLDIYILPLTIHLQMAW